MQGVSGHVEESHYVNCDTLKVTLVSIFSICATIGGICGDKEDSEEQLSSQFISRHVEFEVTEHSLEVKWTEVHVDLELRGKSSPRMINWEPLSYRW